MFNINVCTNTTDNLRCAFLHNYYSIFLKISFITRFPPINFTVNNRLKLSGSCASGQNFYARKLGEITVFYVVKILCILICFHKDSIIVFIWENNSRCGNNSKRDITWSLFEASSHFAVSNDVTK